MAGRVKLSSKSNEAKKENRVAPHSATDFSSSSPSPVHQVLFLQRTLGNQAVQRLFTTGTIQPKLRIGQPKDIYEQEADRVADEIMRMPEPANKPEPTWSFANNSSCTDEEPTQAKPHNTWAANVARSINARAFTFGHNDAFGAGEYSSDTLAGRKLLAHELTHVAQQSIGQVQRTPTPRSLPEIMMDYFRSLPRPVQQILLRYSVYEVERRPNGHWTMRRTAEQPFMDISGGPELLFKLHQQRAHEDYLVLLEQLLVPEITRRRGQPLVRSFRRDRSITEPLMWVRNPPPGLMRNRAYVQRLEAVRARVEPLLRQEVTRRRRSRLTNEGVPGRPNYAFTMGRDRRGSGNRFYTNARRYYTHLRNVTVVDNLRTLDAVLDYVRGLPEDQPIGTIYIISHAHRSGSINFRLSGESEERRFGASELEDAMDELDINPLNTPAVDARTRVIIRGCDVGQDVAILNQLRTAFGGRATVLAPVHKQIYIRRGNTVVEGMARGYWIEYPARPPLSAAQRRARLEAKYPRVPPENWPRWMRDRRWTNRINDTFTYTLKYQRGQDVPSTRAARATAIREQVEQYDEYSWTFRVRHVRGDPDGAYHLIGTGTRSTYTIERPILDERRYWIEYPARPGLSLARRQARLRAKYPQVSPGNWQVWTRQPGWTHTDTIRREITREYENRRDVPSTRRARAAAIIRSRFAQYDEYSWTFRVRRVGRGDERRYRLIANGRKTRYTVSGLREFDLADPTAYGIDERPLPGAAATAVPWR
jgi:hypothetical protein